MANPNPNPSPNPIPNPNLTLTLTTCASKRACVTQLGWAHATEGTHRLALPVSKITLNRCGGVPIPIVPTYWLFLKLRSSCGHHSARAQLATVGVPVVPFGRGVRVCACVCGVSLR